MAAVLFTLDKLMLILCRSRSNGLCRWMLERVTWGRDKYEGLLRQ